MFARFSRARPPAEEDSLAPISAFESETQAVIGGVTPRNTRSVVHGVALLFLVVIVVISVVKIDRIVTSTEGEIVPTEGSIYLQPMDQVIVRQIKVKVGDVVKKGQVLATTDPVFTTAAEAQAAHQAAIDGALLARLEAEEGRVPYMPQGNDPNQLTQLATYNEVMKEYNQSVANFDAQIKSTQALIDQARSDTRKYTLELAANTDIENRWKELDKKGFGSSIQELTAVTAATETARLLADAQQQAIKSGHDLEALTAQRETYIGTFNDQLGTAIVTARTNYNADVQGLAKAKESRLVDEQVVSPMDGIVLTVANASPGTVLTPQTGSTSPLFVVTPLTGPLAADLEITTIDEGFVRVGDPARLKLDAYNFILHGTADGIVQHVSAGTFTLDQNNQPVLPYYKVRVLVTKVHLRDVPKDFRLLPGMTLSGDIVVGHRTIMTYLVEGALRTGSEAMHEP